MNRTRLPASGRDDTDKADTHGFNYQNKKLS
jgi:hypothetical protein